MPFIKGHPVYKGSEKGWFKKGQTPWSASQRGVTLNSGRTHFKKGVRNNPEGEFKKGEKSGENNINWKGDNVGYFGLHSWVERYKGYPEICQSCGREDNLQWASIDGKYIRDIEEWISLCQKCHHKYDNIGEKIWITRRRNGTDKYKNTSR